MNKILKSLGVLTFGFYFANLFSAQAQSPTELDKVAQHKLIEAKMEQMLTLLQDVKDIKDQPNSLASKTYDFFGAVLGESLLISASGALALLITTFLSYNGTIDKFAGTQATLGLGDGLLQEAIKQQNIEKLLNDKEHAPAIFLAAALSGTAIWVGTYGLSKLLIAIENKLNSNNPFDKETKEKLDKIQNLLEQIKFTQEVKSINYSA